MTHTLSILLKGSVCLCLCVCVGGWVCVCVCVCDVAWEQRVRNILLACEATLSCFLHYKEKFWLMRLPCCISFTLWPIWSTLWHRKLPKCHTFSSHTAVIRKWCDMCSGMTLVAFTYRVLKVCIITGIWKILISIGGTTSVKDKTPKWELYTSFWFWSDGNKSIITWMFYKNKIIYKVAIAELITRTFTLHRP